MTATYDEEAERLAKLPRAERFEALITFPANHLIKIIGKTEGLAENVKNALAAIGYTKMVMIERPSAKGKYLSLSLTVSVKNGQELDRIYTILEKLPNLSCLL